VAIKPSLIAAIFLQDFANDFAAPIVHSWQWVDEADQFGLVHSWDVVEPDIADGHRIRANASIDLQAAQLTLSISEREQRALADEFELGRTVPQDSNVTFVALVQFEDQTLTVDGVGRPFTADEIRGVIVEFNGLVA
jgi:hypothetical protein